MELTLTVLLHLTDDCTSSFFGEHYRTVMLLCFSSSNHGFCKGFRGYSPKLTPKYTVEISAGMFIMILWTVDLLRFVTAGMYSVVSYWRPQVLCERAHRAVARSRPRSFTEPLLHSWSLQPDVIYRSLEITDWIFAVTSLDEVSFNEPLWPICLSIAFLLHPPIPNFRAPRNAFMYPILTDQWIQFRRSQLSPL